MTRTKRALRIAGLSALLLATAVAAAYGGLFLWPMRHPHPAPHMAAGTTVIRGARIYVSPDAPVIENGTVVIRDGRIVTVTSGTTGVEDAPADARVVPCNKCTIVAGFWNAHVHFTEPKWSADGSAGAWNANLADMLTSRGFTTVVDTGSDLRITLSIRRRIEEGELAGPAISTAGSALYPPHGLPFYVRESVPRVLWGFLSQPDDPREAVADLETNFARGADLVKLFTGAYVTRDTVEPMPLDIARAAVETGHRHGALVFSHPSDLAGTKVALDSGVDVLAHAPDTTEGIDDALLASLVQKHIAMVPTLEMFATTVTTKDSYLGPIHREVRRFRALGGEILFGTDVGYMREYATEGEIAALVDCGLGPRDILRAMTTAPATRFGVQKDKGTIEVGKLADLVLLDQDPETDVSTLARPRATIRSGEVIFTRS